MRDVFFHFFFQITHRWGKWLPEYDGVGTNWRFFDNNLQKNRKRLWIVNFEEEDKINTEYVEINSQ